MMTPRGYGFKRRYVTFELTSLRDNVVVHGDPDLNNEGFLPIGVHDASLEEVRARFGTFQKSDQRRRLFKAFDAFIAQARQIEFACEILIDGSFVTGKDEPGDVDLLLILKPGFDFSAELRPFEYNFLSRRQVRKRYKFDLLTAEKGSVLEAEYVAFYQQIRGRPDRGKGVLRLRLEFRFTAMINNDAEFRQTLEQLQRMYRAIEQLREDVLPRNPRLFAVMAEGPLDHVRQFQEELEQYRLSLLNGGSIRNVG